MQKELVMLEFEPYSLDALNRALPYIHKNAALASDYSAGYLFMWQKSNAVSFCFWKNTCVIRQTIGEQAAFSWPMGEHPDEMLDELLVYVKEHQLALRFYPITEDQLTTLRQDSRFSQSLGAYDRRWSDYLYSFEDVLTFRGRKYSGQRNHINKFRRLYGEPQIRFITPADHAGIHTFLTSYSQEHPSRSALEELELTQTLNLLEVYEPLGLFAACMEYNHTIIALSIGELIGDTLIIHVEKALTSFDGIYPTMYQGFVQLVASQIGYPLRYVNREDDAGDSGLRTSKMQYHPVEMIHKYLVHVHSPGVLLKEYPVLKGDSLFITGFRDTDKQNYFALNTDIENNRFWGYDYREDIGITPPADEDTFFDAAWHDMQAGDSINFALRLREDGEMIGEGILWNFKENHTAELGCRLLPGYHGRGYGKLAFGLLTQFAETQLHLRVVARCYHQNLPSSRMITANGFQKTGEDETFFYFEHPTA
ncbi:MAG: GNAT family N-acetyltransferase [Lachnospiraceae bacterium]|nr:GNAT family N-acetyltransferase [Lachnospiraceae bacterium]